MENEMDCDNLLNGLLSNGQMCKVSKLCATERVVSFLRLPNYINDEDVLQKLQSWGVTPILPLRRRYYPGTTVADGRVKFPKDVVSLPYNTSFETEEGTQFFRVIHNQQVKICRICSSAEHEKKDCPQLTCRECLEQGHYARDCTAPRCQGCRKALLRCICETDEEEHEEMEMETHNEVEYLEEADEENASQQTGGLTKDILSSEGEEEEASENEQHGEDEAMTGLQLSVDNVEQDVMENKEDNDGTKDSTTPEEVSDTGEKRKRDLWKEKFLSRGTKVKKTGQINIEKALERQRIRR
uniref:CCHC-type domain-containing protein n=1 Tax=Sinocyclocheilus rhinocerous TaxID=307959 RepID=A0A673LRR2_9TELE